MPFRKFGVPQSPRRIFAARTVLAINIAVVSNEAREVNAYRIHHFKLRPLVDFFVSSCFVHLRKPDPDIFRLALDMAQDILHLVVSLEASVVLEVAENKEKTLTLGFKQIKIYPFFSFNKAFYILNKEIVF